MFYSDSYVFKFFKIVQVYLRLASFRAFIFFPKRMSDKKPIGNIQKEANLSALSPIFSSCIIYTNVHFLQKMNFKVHYLEIPLLDFCETLHNRRQASKVYVA